MRTTHSTIAVGFALALAVAGCSSESDTKGGGGASSTSTSAQGTGGASGAGGSGTGGATAGSGGGGGAGGGPAHDYDSKNVGADGSGIGGAIGTPFVFDVAKRYAKDADFRASIANYGQMQGNPLFASFDPSKAGTGDKNSLYIDGNNPDLAEWDPSAGPDGEPAIVLTIKGLDQPTSSPTPQLAAAAKNKHSLWLWVRRRYEPGFDSYGDADDANGAATWNMSQGAGLKMGPYAGYGYGDSLAMTTYYGRAGLQTGNGTANSTADYDLVNLPQGSPQPKGVDDTIIGKLTKEWTDGEWRDYLVYIGNTLDGDGVIRVAAEAWVRTLKGGAFVPIGSRLTGDIGPSTSFERPRFNEIEPYMLNANRARKTDEHFQVWGWAAFDAESVPDPYGVLGGG